MSKFLGPVFKNDVVLFPKRRKRPEKNPKKTKKLQILRI